MIYKNNEMLETTDYTLFGTISSNRETVKPHINKLAQSLTRTGGNILPIITVLINGKLTVIDGQHRIEASMIAGTPIRYVVLVDGTDTDKLMIELNITSKNWSLTDFVKHYADKGVDGFKEILDLNHNLNLHPTAIFTLTSVQPANVKNGTPLAVNYEKSIVQGNITVSVISALKKAFKTAPRETRIASAVLMVDEALSYRNDKKQWCYETALKNLSKVIKDDEISDSPSSVAKLLSKSFDYGKNKSNKMNLIPQG